MKNKTFTYFGQPMTVSVHCEGNDCVYPRITDRIVTAEWNGRFVRVQNKTQQGYDANKNVKLTTADISMAMKLLHRQKK